MSSNKVPMEWYKAIQCPLIREAAILNAQKLKSLHATYNALPDALGTGFPWCYTTQGYAFWNAIHDDACKSSIKEWADYRHLLEEVDKKTFAKN